MEYAGYISGNTYDTAGNILTFNNGINSHTYTYGNADWRDLLTVVDGHSLTYDEIGNPLTYYNGEDYTMTWAEGRRLQSVTVDNKTTTYEYDYNGYRTKKTNADGSYIMYYIVAGRTVGEVRHAADGTITLYMRYVFDEADSVIGYSLWYAGDTDWTTCYFLKNLQGDVIQIYRGRDNALMAEYTYDSWGNVISATGALAEMNPFRYRGYYYDVETGFYATGTRYYDSTIGRFINVDNQISGVGNNIRGYNLFAYCFNNPVNTSDPTGDWPRWITATVASVATVVAVVATVVAAPIVATVASSVAVVSTIAYVAQSHHYDKRKAKNTSVPKTYDEAMKKEGADNTINAACHQFTATDKPNKKVCWPDGTEGIYNSSGKLVLDPRDVGTYNFSVPNGGWSSVWHGVVDVAPWIVFGNDDDDNTWMYQRVISLFNGG